MVLISTFGGGCCCLSVCNEEGGEKREETCSLDVVFGRESTVASTKKPTTHNEHHHHKQEAQKATVRKDREFHAAPLHGSSSPHHVYLLPYHRGCERPCYLQHSCCFSCSSPNQLSQWFAFYTGTNDILLLIRLDTQLSFIKHKTINNLSYDRHQSLAFLSLVRSVIISQYLILDM